jgi:hypothetical protein
MKAADTTQTTDRSAIRKLYEELRIAPEDFCCKYVSQCCPPPNTFIKGTWPYVGPEYGHAMIAGCPARVLFVGMEQCGRDRTMTFDKQQHDFRAGAETRKNRHMGGVASIMERLVDKPPPADYSLQFALTNAVKCTKKGRRSDSALTTRPIMIENCAASRANHRMARLEHAPRTRRLTFPWIRETVATGTATVHVLFRGSG